MKTVICPTCDAELEWNTKTCPYCGAALKANRKIVACRVCDEPVSKNAKRCPHCGTRNPNKSANIARAIGVCVLILYFLSFIVGDNTKDSASTPHESNTTPTTSEETATPEEKAVALLGEATTEFQGGDYMAAIKLCDQITTEYPATDTAANMAAYLEEQYAQFPRFSARDLMSEYDANVVNADEKYTDTVMIVTGTVSAIGKTNNDTNLTVMLKSGTYFYGVQLNFKTSQTDAVASLSEGDTITVIGKCTGQSGTQFLVLEGNNVMIENCYILNQ